MPEGTLQRKFSATLANRSHLFRHETACGRVVVESAVTHVNIIQYHPIRPNMAMLVTILHEFLSLSYVYFSLLCAFLFGRHRTGSEVSTSKDQDRTLLVCSP